MSKPKVAQKAVPNKRVEIKDGIQTPEIYVDFLENISTNEHGVKLTFSTTVAFNSEVETRRVALRLAMGFVSFARMLEHLKNSEGQILGELPHIDTILREIAARSKKPKKQ